jgi:outer membrane immunogenic protein
MIGLLKNGRELMQRLLIILFSSFLNLNATSLHAKAYIGLGLGPDLITLKQTAHIMSPAPFGFNVIDKKNLSGTGIFGSLFAGIEGQKNKIAIAIEGNVDISSANYKSSNKEFNNENYSQTQYKMSQGLGLSILPGYLITPTSLFYGRIGYTNTHLKIATNDASLNNFSGRLNGVKLGAGIRQALSEAILIRLEYELSQYKSIDLKTFDALSLVTKNTNIKPRQHQVALSIVAQFNMI